MASTVVSYCGRALARSRNCSARSPAQRGDDQKGKKRHRDDRHDAAETPALQEANARCEDEAQQDGERNGNEDLGPDNTAPR